MSDKEKVLYFLRDHEGKASKTQVFIDIFRSGRSQSELAELLSTQLAGLVSVHKRKNRETWKLTSAGWAAANQIVVENTEPTQTEMIPDDFTRFKQLASENPEASAQRLLQLTARHVGDPLEDTDYWKEFRAQNSEWFLQQPREWYSRDVELDTDGYPVRVPENPLTGKERGVRPNSERGWFEFAVRCPGASLEPLAVAMPAYECANILRVTKKVGESNAVDIFGPERIATARRLAGIGA